MTPGVARMSPPYRTGPGRALAQEEAGRAGHYATAEKGCAREVPLKRRS